jgi:CO dehydrogenase maturation factor
MELKYKDLFVIVNKITAGRREKVLENATCLGLTVIGTIPYDESLARFDLVGDPLTGLPDDSPAVQEMVKVVGALGL